MLAMDITTLFRLKFVAAAGLPGFVKASLSAYSLLQIDQNNGSAERTPLLLVNDQRANVRSNPHDPAGDQQMLSFRASLKCCSDTWWGSADATKLLYISRACSPSSAHCLVTASPLEPFQGCWGRRAGPCSGPLCRLLWNAVPSECRWPFESSAWCSDCLFLQQGSVNLCHEMLHCSTYDLCLQQPLQHSIFPMNVILQC